jgi:two-component system cell cycle sensor histidine kinase/response regulator CckA
MNTTALVKKSHRLLVIDDNPRIHEDIRKILCPAVATGDMLLEAEAALFGDALVSSGRSDFTIDSAYQGQEGLALVEKAVAENRPYSMAFVDVRMPPGWDGIETIQRIWQCYPDLQVVICTAYSDHSWDEIINKLGNSDSLVILKKPFDNVEVLQLAHALTKKWVVTRQARSRLDELETLVQCRTQELVHANQRLQGEIDRRAAVEVALRASEERFHKSFESTTVALTILRADTLALTDVNKSFLELAGISREQGLGKTPFDLNLPQNEARFRSLIKKLEDGEPVLNAPETLRRGDQQLREVLLSIVPLALGNQPSYLAAVLDVTDQRRLEVQLRQSQKMDAIGQLAAGVAHDFNNILTVIIGHASIQLNKATLDREVGKSLEQVKLAAERAAGLTRQLLTFSRKQVIERKPLHVGDCVNRLRQMLERLLGATVVLNCDCAANLPQVLADESNLEQILLNLAVNARDAMPHGGTLGVSVKAVELSITESFRHPDARAGRFVALEVQDTGEGMDEATLNRAFEPFFTTKPVGKGTGLGLSTVFGIVQQHEGWIEIVSQVGAGTTFKVFLPAVERSIQMATNTPAAPAVSETTKSQTILVVEDEDMVRQYVCDALRSDGYQVLDAACAEEALVLWEKSGGEVDLLLTDMVMPGINGKLLARRLRHSKKELKLVYMSGYSPDMHATEHWTQEKPLLLQKPFDRDLLCAAIHRVVNAPQPDPCAVK